MQQHTPFLPSKLPQIGTTIFTSMSALARQHQAINLSQGFPDFDCDAGLIHRVQESMQAGHNQYAPMAGLPQLRTFIAQLQTQLYQAKYDPESEITITCGATEALMCAIQAIVHPGDEVIIIEPAYDSYLPAILLSRGIPVSIPLTYPEYRIDWEKVRAAIGPKTRALIFNTPHNPTGTIWQKEDLTQLTQIVQDTSLLLISDEVYEHILFDGEEHQSISRVPELKDRALVISSFGKTLHTTGWKVGYCMAPAALTTEFRKVHQFTTFSTATPFQHAIAHYMEEELDKILNLKHFYQRKRDLFLELMSASRFSPLPCKGTYFQLMTYEQISDMSDTEFAQYLTIEHGVAVIPVSAFYEDGQDHRVIRFCFAKKDETLKAATERLRQV